ncbi:coiled-coil domain-containing protein 8 homolog [Colossoma macropomum]|uniref:coiled-coil domain-containing protein 8 homolog n=1 Tax=Colossoma macropomum TaxID=42526 RepID=UPI0018645F26|nr:coiled-coil domain-containing protein 8 homolog [Colossoma macropomum]
MGAKLSRRKSECAPAAEGVVAESTATEQPETAEALATTETNEQKPDEAENAAEPKASEKAPAVDTASSEQSSNLGAVETITQAVEEIVSSVSEQIAVPVDDMVNKGMGAVEAMMAAVSVKDDPTEPATEPKAEPLVDLSEEATPKIDLSIPEPPEEPAHLPSEPSTLDELLLSQPNAESLLPDHVSAAVAKDVSLVAVEDEGIPIQNEAQAPSESEEPLVCMKQDAAPAEDLLNCEASADPATLNSDSLVDLGDMEQALSKAVNTVNDLI